MIWIAFLMILLVPVVIWAVLVQEEEDTKRRRPPMAWLKRWWPNSVEERRHCYRYEAGVPMSYRVVGSGETSTTNTQTRDISFGGVGFLLYEKMPLGTVLEITLMPQDNGQPLKVQGVIQWIREIPQNPDDARRIFWAGIQILHSGMGTVDRLRSLLEQISHERGRGHA